MNWIPPRSVSAQMLLCKSQSARRHVPPVSRVCALCQWCLRKCPVKSDSIPGCRGTYRSASLPLSPGMSLPIRDKLIRVAFHGAKSTSLHPPYDCLAYCANLGSAVIFSSGLVKSSLYMSRIFLSFFLLSFAAAGASFCTPAMRSSSDACIASGGGYGLGGSAPFEGCVGNAPDVGNAVSVGVCVPN
jgi:hypothetical protein